MLEKDSMMKLKLHKLMKVRRYLFLRNSTTKTVSSFCSDDKHPDDFVGHDSNPNNCAATYIAAGAVTC